MPAPPGCRRPSLARRLIHGRWIGSPESLQRRLTVGVVGITSSVVLLGAIAIWASSRAFLVRGMERELATHVERLRWFDTHFPRRGPGFRPGPEPGREEPGKPAPAAPVAPAESVKAGGAESGATVGTESGQGPADVGAPARANGGKAAEPGTEPGRDRGRNEERRNQPGDPGGNQRLFFQMTDAVRGGDAAIIARSWNLPAEARLGDGAGPDPEGSHWNDLPDGHTVLVRGLTISRIPPFVQRLGGPAQASALTSADLPAERIAASVSAASALRPAEPWIDEVPGSSTPVYQAWVSIDATQDLAELGRLGWWLAALWLAATVLAFAAVLVLGSTILKPVRRLAHAIDRLGPDDLAQRLPEGAGPEEIRSVVGQLNQLFGRLEEAFRREQATIAAIAHELRTPVAVLRSTIEFRRMAGPPPAEDQVLATCLRTVTRMQTMVGNLLLLARLEAGKEPLQRALTDVSSLVAEAIEPFDGRIIERRLQVDEDLPDSAPLETSPDHLRILVANLVGNAVAHCPEGSRIRIALERAGDGPWTLVVANPTAQAIDPARLGEPFFRGDAARGGDGHSGLGLTLCRRLARLLDADLRLTVGEGSTPRFTARLTLPAGRISDAPAAG